MAAVVGLVIETRQVITVQVAAQSRDVYCRVALIACGFRAGEAAVQGHAVLEPERRMDIAAGSGRRVGARGDPDLVGDGRGQCGLQVAVGINPTAAIIGARGALLDIDRGGSRNGMGAGDDEQKREQQTKGGHVR